MIPGRGTGSAQMMELRYDRPAGRAQPERPSSGPVHDRIAYTDTSCHGRRITVSTYGPATAGAASAFHTWGEIARCGALRSNYRRRWEWATLEAARAGHQDIVGWLTGVAAWLAGVTDEIPPLPQVPGTSRQPPATAVGPQARPGIAAAAGLHASSHRA